MIANVNNCK